MKKLWCWSDVVILCWILWAVDIIWRINSLRPSDAYMLQQKIPTWLAPSHYMNNCWHVVNMIFGNKFQWNLNGNFTFSFKKCIWKCQIENDGHFVSLTTSHSCIYSFENLTLILYKDFQIPRKNTVSLIFNFSKIVMPYVRNEQKSLSC